MVLAQVVLASASPRRQMLLQQIGLPHQACPPGLTENLDPEAEPAREVQRLAQAKARDVARKCERGLVLGADTVVVDEERVLGKPGTAGEAVGMLQALSGGWHRVLTGVAVWDVGAGTCETAVETTWVRMRRLEPGEIRLYVETGEPLDKAGAYGIQGKGSLLVQGIRGCYFNVVGLPLVTVCQMLGRQGLDVWEEISRKG